MPNREKVIAWLADEELYYREHGDTHNSLMACDALELLKQEAVEPLAQVDDTFECSCGAIVGWDELDASGIVQARLNYCPFCGKPISWEGR